MSTSPSAGSGTGRSTSLRTSGPPNSVIWMGRMDLDITVRRMSFVPSHEEQLLRESVAGIAAGFGPAYIREKVEREEPPRELWDALAEKGFLGVNIPEEYDGGGR